MRKKRENGDKAFASINGKMPESDKRKSLLAQRNRKWHTSKVCVCEMWKKCQKRNEAVASNIGKMPQSDKWQPFLAQRRLKSTSKIPLLRNIELLLCKGILFYTDTHLSLSIDIIYSEPLQRRWEYVLGCSYNYCGSHCGEP